MSDDLIQEFLKGQTPNQDERRKWFKNVWFGEVHYHNRQFQPQIKALCQGEDPRGSAATFCPVRKLWGTGSFEQVPKLLATTHWIPIGFDPALCQQAALAAQRTLDERMRKAQNEEERKDAEAQERKRKSDVDAVERATKRLRSERGWVEFHKEHFDQAAQWGMSPEMLQATEQIGCFGFCSDNWNRVRKWFDLHVNYLGMTAEQVMERDVLPEFAKILANQAQTRSSLVNAMPASGRLPKRGRQDESNAAVVVARLARQEEAREKRKRNADEMYRTDPHRLALEALLSKQRDAPIHSYVIRACPVCQEVVSEQFLDCMCCESASSLWARCEKCMLIVHPKINPCKHV